MDIFQQKAQQREATGQQRLLRNIDQIALLQEHLINLSSNDYLGLASDPIWQQEFFQQANPEDLRLSAASSRLLTGETNQSEKLEKLLARLYKRDCLVFNSGYHANSGIIPTLTDKHTLILADKLIHASMIEGIQLSQARSIRFRHNDINQLRSLVHKYASEYPRILILTESIFSMDGDEAPLLEMVALKKEYNNIEIYLDEAHAVGVRGESGLGCAQELGIVDDIDYLLGTFGKALASSGAFLVCNKWAKDELINSCRTFIFTTAPAPINLSWSYFVLQQLEKLTTHRARLTSFSNRLHAFLKEKGLGNQSTSHIIPVILGDNHRCIEVADTLQKKGLYILPVRPPTVPIGSSRLRISLSAALSEDDFQFLLQELDSVL